MKNRICTAISILCFSLVLLTTTGCSKSAPAPAAAVEKPKVEGELARTTLSADAVKSLRIKTEPVRRPEVQEKLLLTGWIMAKQGNEVTLTAQSAGYVRAPTGGELVSNGAAVQKGQEVLALEPVLSQFEQLQLAALRRSVDNEIAKAKESLAVAESELSRMQELHTKGLRSAQDLEQAVAKAKHAREDLAAARDKKKLYGGNGDGPAQFAPVPIQAPRSGTVLNLLVSPGQYVPAAAPLLTIADLSTLWVRVPVPEQDLPRINREAPATITYKRSTDPGGDRKPPLFEGKRVALVPQVDPLRHTADMVYELIDLPKDAVLAKDQMVVAYVPLGAKKEETVVPYSAVVFDAYGGAWVYIDTTTEEAKTHVYERRRVDLGAPAEGGVVVRRGVTKGENVVTKGAAAIFSREFHKPPVAGGGGKVEDDDD